MGLVLEALKKTEVKEKGTAALKKSIGLLEAIMLVVGMVIGSGIFFKPSIVFKNAGSPMLGILAWVAGGVIAMAAGLTLAEIGAAIPKTGGVFVYLKELYGDIFAFLFGWVQTVIYVPGAAAALAIVFAIQATYFIPMTAMQQKLLAIFMLFFLMTINVISTKFGARIQLFATIGKLIPIVVIIGYGLLKGTAHSFSTPAAGTITGSAGFGAAILGTLWAYDGWQGVSSIAGELKNPKKDIPRSIIIGVSLILAIYILINVAVINVLPMTAVVASKKAASDVAVALFGSGGASFIAAGITISIFGALNGYLMTGIRIPFAMAQDKMLPFSGFLGKVNEKYSTPLNTFVVEVIIASLYVLTGSFDTLTDLATFIIWIFFTMAVAGIFILRTKFKDIERPYSVPLYPVIPLLGIIGGAYVVISTILTNTTNALYGLGIMLTGLPVYLYIKRKNK